MKTTILAVLAACVLVGTAAGADEPPRVPDSTHNLLLDAKTSGNLAAYGKGGRGAPGDVIYDPQRRQFARASQWHEYGVGFGQDLGVIAEDKPAWWMAVWPKPVQANLIVLTGVYPNQPQPQTCWKIELRRDGKWTPHARGQGGWYDAGRYVWGGLRTESVPSTRSA